MIPRHAAIATMALALVLTPSIHAQMTAAAHVALMQDDAGVVVGEPCIVVETIKIEQPLADGTTLTRRTEEHKWRDAQGRFRRETYEVNEGRNPEFRSGFIIDPTNNTLTTFNLERKTATIFHLPDQGPDSLHPYMELDDKQLLARPGVQVKVEKLDGKTIAGVYAVGRRVTRIRPPGTIGNDKPVISVAERWVSPDLKILLAQFSDDPREKQTRQVTKLDQSEPDPSLFTIPADFSIKEVTVQASQRAEQ
jgi:hypothetical protein